MAKNGADLDALVYLDVDFISRKYEGRFGVDPAQKTAKSEGLSAGISAIFGKANANVQETRTFSLTSWGMFRALKQSLEEGYGELGKFENYVGTRLGWIQGSLSIGKWASQKEGGPVHEFFELTHSSGYVLLLTQDVYFSAGFAQALASTPAIKANIKIPVRCLVRAMWRADNAETLVVCPYVILEESVAQPA